MEPGLRIRPACAADAAALAELMARSPDAGRVAFTWRFSADLLEVMQALATSLEAAIAVRDGAPVGMVFGDFAEVQWSGARRPGVYVSNLRVDPVWRRRGVARALADWGLARVVERLGADAVVYSAVLEGNASAVLVGELGFRPTAPIRGALVPARRRPPHRPPDLQLRDAGPADGAGIAAGMNAFYAAHNLWTPVSATSLADFASREVGGVRPNRLLVVTRGAEVLGGLSVADRTALVRMVVTGASPLLRAAGRALGLLPGDGALRALSVRHVWFRPGELEAVRSLWQTLRFQAGRSGHCLGIAYDPRDASADVYRLPRWLPTFPGRYLVRSSAGVEPERPTYCVAGA